MSFRVLSYVNDLILKFKRFPWQKKDTQKIQKTKLNMLS